MHDRTLFKSYEDHADRHEWNEALAVIREIIALSPHDATSWVNCGVCLEGLGRHAEAAEAFIKAQETAIMDVGIHYRILRSLRLANDHETFFEFLAYSVGIVPDVLHAIDGDPDFNDLKKLARYRSLHDGLRDS